MNLRFTFLMLLVAGLLAACGIQKSPDPNDLKAALGMSKEEVEFRFGRPALRSTESSKEHPGGYWVYEVNGSGGTQCKLDFDLPHRVLATRC